jgi:hypothetical protein
MKVEKWEDRLAKMDHSKGTTDKMRKEAMLAEIKALRRSAASAGNRVAKSVRNAIYWRQTATRYQTALAQERTKLHIAMENNLSDNVATQ